MDKKIYRCSKDVVLAAKVLIQTGNDVTVLAEINDSFNIPSFIVKFEDKLFSTHKKFFNKHFYFLKYEK